MTTIAEQIAAARAEERERCAMVCEKRREQWLAGHESAEVEGNWYEAANCAAAIRNAPPTLIIDELAPRTTEEIQADFRQARREAHEQNDAATVAAPRSMCGCGAIALAYGICAACKAATPDHVITLLAASVPVAAPPVAKMDDPLRSTCAACGWTQVHDGIATTILARQTHICAAARAPVAAPPETRCEAAVETDWRAISEEWRIACVEWSAWAASILTQYGLQLPGGKWGHAVAREKIAALMATPRSCVPAATSQKGRVEVLETALDHATRSLDAIARRKPLPGVALFESIDEVRDYATSRAAVARAALAPTEGR